jgi:DUF971 family protein
VKPERISAKGEHIIFEWTGGAAWTIPLKYLRDECPCAGCKGETILLHTYRPDNPAPVPPEGYAIQAIIPVGAYAIQIHWKDRHDAGIYSWEYLEVLNRDKGEQKPQQYDTLL